MNLIFDIETNGLLPHMLRPEHAHTAGTKIHCMVIRDADTGEQFTCNNGQTPAVSIEAGLQRLMLADMVIGHNIISFDIPFIQTIYPWFHPKAVLDTLVLSRLIHANIKDTDIALMRSGRLPGNLWGRHSLEAWGYRTGTFKDEYEGGPNISDPVERKARKWESWNQTMQDYCEQDGVATQAVLDKMRSDRHYFSETGSVINDSIGLEHRAAILLAQMERNGFPFNTRGAAGLYAELVGKRQELADELRSEFGSWWQPCPAPEPFRHPTTDAPLSKYPKVRYPTTGDLYLKDGRTLSKSQYYKDRPFTPIEHIQFNPGSRDHIAKVLKDCGWVPTETTETGKPKVDEEVLLHVQLPDPDKNAKVALIRDYLTVTKRTGQVAEGDNGWLKLVQSDGCIHGSINPNGAVTGRCTHATPNVTATPAVGAPYGHECRDLWGAKYWRHRWPEAVQVGSDAAGLELRCLAHFLVPYDGGAYRDIVLDGDVHWVNTIAFGLVPEGTVRDSNDQSHSAARNLAKRLIYALLYGGGAATLGAIVGGGQAEGKALKAKFLAAIPAVKLLLADLDRALIADSKWCDDGTQKIKWKRRWLRGLDGRKLHVRSPHSALNLLLQSAGALICKQWIIETDSIMRQDGFAHGPKGDYMLVAYVHDEQQNIARTEAIAQRLIAASKRAMKEVERIFNFKCPLDDDSKTGLTWADTH